MSSRDREYDFILHKMIAKYGEGGVEALVRLANRKGYGGPFGRKPLKKVSLREEVNGVEEYSTLCCKCDKEIYEYDGFILSGNICVAAVKENGQPFGGLVGNSFDNYQEAYCKVCFLETISSCERYGGSADEPPRTTPMSLVEWLRQVLTEASKNENNPQYNFDSMFQLYQNGSLSTQDLLSLLNLPTWA